MEFEGRTRMSLNLNMAPLIDVVFLLLIFFMLTSSYIVADAIDLELPFSSSSRTVDDQDIVVSLHLDGAIFINNDEVLRKDLTEKLSAMISNPDKQTLTLKTASEENVQDMIDLMDLIRAAGGTRILIATQGSKPASSAGTTE